MKPLPDLPLKHAGFRDVDFVSRCIAAAIHETLGHVPEYCSQEKARFPKKIIRALIDADPDYVVLVMSPEGKAAGFILSSPEQGNVILNWSYLLPDHRKGVLALVAMKSYLKLWQNKRFHKIIAFTKTDNRAPQLIMQRSGYASPILLRQHLFGVDFLMYEYFLNKTQAGYHRGVEVGLKGLFLGRLRSIFRNV
jgi:hypothetical protein